MITSNPTFLLMLSLVTLSLPHALLTNAQEEEDLRLDGGVELGWDISNWFVTLDGVMGGKSDGELVYTEENTVLSFSGDIVLNGGGFSSVRKRMDFVTDLTPYAGVVVELEPHAYNGQAPLGMHLQFHDQPSRYGYSAAFAVPIANDVDENTPTTAVYIPMENFDRATRGGFRCRESSRCTLDPTRINEMDLYVLFQEGLFEVNVHSITAVRNATSFPSPQVTIASSTEVQNLIQDTTNSGGAVYNYGYTEICNAVYRSTLNTLMASVGGGVTDEMKAVICDGLERAATFEYQEKVDTAWSLRGTLDAVWDIASMETDAPIIISASTINWEEECMAVTSHPPVDFDANYTYAMTDVERTASTSHDANEKMPLMGQALLQSSSGYRAHLVCGAALGLILHTIASLVVA